MCQQQAKSSASQATEEAGGGDGGGLLFVPMTHRKKARVPADHRTECVECYSIAVGLRWCRFCTFIPVAREEPQASRVLTPSFLCKIQPVLPREEIQ